MLMPITCPICKDILITSYPSEIQSYDRLRKLCNNKTNHVFDCLSYPSKDDFSLETVESILIDYGTYRELRIVWLFKTQITHISKNDYIHTRHILQFPFIEIDFNNIQKTINKIKTYATFT